MFLKRLSLLDFIFLFFICILCYLIFFKDLGEYSVRMWDESRNGVNAIEMLRNGNPIVTYYNGSPDMWNTKPPLFIWSVVLSFHIFGINEFALRFPSALSASLVAISMYLFASKYLKNKWIGIFSTLILFSSFGFSDTHIGRSGDYDALLTFLTFNASIFTFIYLQDLKNQKLIKATIFWTLAVLTKGIAGILLIPGIFVYSILTKKIASLVKNKQLWISVGIFLLFVVAYYLSRNFLNPGYMAAVWEEELFGRATSSNTSEGMFVYYWKLLTEFRFQYWSYIVPVSILAYFLTDNKTYKNWILFSYITIVFFYIIISLTQAKNMWYDAQLYPFASLLIATFVIKSIQKLPKILWIFPIIFLCFYTQRFIRTNLAYIQRPDLEINTPCIKYGYFLREENIKTKNLYGVHSDPQFCMPFTFYMRKENIPTKQLTEIATGDRILTCDDEVTTQLKEQFGTKKILDNAKGCVIVELQ